ncbi:hypothetical protein AX15_004900 [Amanita polypyramis BW_CC]|nr:hypothetical protein AX15_004900 [Amanita polypyramis BW_CC]
MPLHIAFIHPDLGIGGAERLVVDAALGLQNRGHVVHIYTSHHDPAHAFEETTDGQLRVLHIPPPFPRSILGKLHIVFAHARQLHLSLHLLAPWGPTYDVFFVDQLSTCVPLLRLFARTRVVFYCHFPDKLLASGAFVDGKPNRPPGLLKRVYRYPMDWLEEVTTRQADAILANSKFTARVFKSYFNSIRHIPRIVYPGINISAYQADYDPSCPDIASILSDRPTLLSLNRFEKKKNAALAVDAFALLRRKVADQPEHQNVRLVLAGGYDPRLADNISTLQSLIDLANAHSLTYNIVSPHSSDLPRGSATTDNAHVLFLVNFITSQRTALLSNLSTRVLLYTPANEHFGIGPVEAMCCGVPVLACDSGGPTESVLVHPPSERTGWLRTPDPEVWANVLVEIIGLSTEQRQAMARRAKQRAHALFGMEAMAEGIEAALREAAEMGAPVWWRSGFPERVMSYFPPEICLAIFEFATWVHNVHGPDPLDMNFQLFITKDHQRTLRRSLRTKLALVHVCRAWKALASSLLYENIIIGRGGYLPAICSVLEASRRQSLQQDPDETCPLGHWTKRLDIALRDSSRPADEELALLADIVYCLPNLEIVTFSLSSIQYAQDDFSPCFILRALASTCAPSLKYIHWFRDTLVPDGQDLCALLRKTPNLRSFRTPLVSVRNCEESDEKLVHTSIMTVHAERSIADDLDYPVPPQVMDLPSLRQLSFVVPLFSTDARWAKFLETHGPRLQHIQVLIYSASSHLQPDLAHVATSCSNLIRLDFVFSQWLHMPFPVTLPPTVQHLGIFCAQGQISNYNAFFSHLDNLEYSVDFKCIQFLGKRNVMDIFRKHLHQFLTGTARLRSNGIRFSDHKGRCLY